MWHELRSAMQGCWWAVATLICCLAPGMLLAEQSQPDAAARRLAAEILAATGVKGGLVVHLGCGDGRLTAALRADNKYTVHGLDRDPAKVKAARECIAGLGLYGPVSVEQLAGAALPYADNLINLIVAEDSGSISQAEMVRVLAPQGAAYVKTNAGWQKTVKPRPKNIDEWSHFLHDAGNNAVARDALVGPPRSLQWVAPPLWLRSHETPSGFEALVSSGGRLCYFFDEGLIGITDQRLPERWSLVCRDAFNGKLLWKRPVEPWGWPQWARERFADQDWTTITGGRTVVPEENQRRLVLQGDRLYATLGYRAPLSILDAATGKTLATVKETEPVAEILASDGIVVVRSGEPRAAKGEARAAKAKRRGGEKSGEKDGEDAKPSALVAVQGDTGKVLWQKESKAINPLQVAIDGGRVVYQAGSTLTCLGLTNGEKLWEADSKTRARTLIAHNGFVLIYSGSNLEAHDAASGKLLWHADVPPSTGGESEDLFVVGDLVWRGIVPVNENLKPIAKSADAMAVGFDLRTGEPKKQIVVRQLRSPEHHHRCYRNKATEQYIISGMEGAEFMDLAGDNHCQNNFLRGACKLGIMPCNGLLYVPADQCFCQPGAKLLGFAAVAGESPARSSTVADDRRLEKGEAFGAVDSSAATGVADDWPTYRHDPGRHGSTPSAVPPPVASAWKVKLGGTLTAPVAAAGRAYVASRDAHTLYALDMSTGKILWKYLAGGRIDSPPTLYKGLVLFGSADGRVYCLRAADGALAWRFLAAPADCRIAYFDQIESVWPVSGSVLVRDGIAYAAAGRSTYLDGGIRLYALQPFTGAVLHKTMLQGPFPDTKNANRDYAFYLPGANAEVLVSEGDYIYMRQKKLTPELREVQIPVLSSKGEQDVGLHVFSTSGLLDDSWYNRAFWMYAKRWPGFQLANQAPKSGQLLVVDQENTFAMQPYYRRNVHTPMFFPGKEGYLLFADRNSTEPQIVGEEGARKPVEWLPQSHIPRAGNPGLDSNAFGLDKMIGYTRAERPLWTKYLPIRIRAMVKAADVVFVAGAPDVLEADDPYAAFEGRKGARVAAISSKDGARLAECELGVPPVFDGLIAAGGRLLVSLEDGSLMSLSGEAAP